MLLKKYTFIKRERERGCYLHYKDEFIRNRPYVLCDFI